MQTTKQDIILIVDDNPTNIKVIADFLKESGVKVIIATSGESCLQKLEKILPDMILLDVVMPGMNGFETCQRLKDSSRTKDIPVIFMTAASDSDPMQKVKGLTIGAVDYISKPIIGEEVLARINIHLSLRNLTKELQEAKEAADSANKAKSEFLAQMSHELRTPLNGILGIAQIMQKSDRQTVEDLSYINIIYESGVNLLRLIEDILDLSKIEAHKIELVPREFDFYSFLDGVVNICRIRAEEKEIYFTYELTSGLPKKVKADDKRLRQVLINLLGNAIKFTEVGGVTFTVSLSSGADPAPLTTDNSQLTAKKIRFQIEDTGIGMTPEQLEKIFLPFEQVGNSKQRAQGTGLGLAIGHKLVQLMGSSLQVTSQPGVGSVFWMDLDLPEVTEPAETVKAESKSGQLDLLLAPSLPLRILVAEDTRVNQKIILIMLEKMGYRADVVNNGAEALEALRRQPYDVILMDVQMPEMDGIKATRCICQEWARDSRPNIIAVTAHAMSEEKEKCLAAGMNDYLTKPLQFDSLFQALSKCKILQYDS